MSQARLFPQFLLTWQWLQQKWRAYNKLMNANANFAVLHLHRYADKNVPNEKNLIMNDKDPLIFDPGNEPYFGRILRRRYDQAISVVLGQNDRIVPLTYAFVLNDAQQVVVQIIEPNPNQHGPFCS